jgi:hypothetical protein|tara:strand:+ start:501 stop:1055 length:555 start_codon:yes stop_codon:yes gene_type:complete
MPKTTGDKKKPDKTLANKRIKDRQDAFLIAYGKTGTINSACKALGMDRSNVYSWRKKDVQNFKFRFETAHEIFREGLFDMALERIKQQKPDGNPVLFLAALNAFWPEKFRRDAYKADDGAKEMMGEWKKWKKDQEKSKKKTGREITAEEQEDQQELEERKNAIDEVEKILSRRKNGGEGKKSKG